MSDKISLIDSLIIIVYLAGILLIGIISVRLKKMTSDRYFLAGRGLNWILVGAGDSFTAILIAGMLNKMKLEDIHSAATNVAALVCSMHAATPKLPEHLLSQIERQ